jgi:DNA-binding beta-propeller fold protein YncE
VAVSRGGVVYVADCYNHRIQYFSTDMRHFQGKWGAEGEGRGQFKYPRSVALKRDGTVFVSESSRVQYFTGGGVVKAVWGSQGSGDGQFNRARGIAVAPNGTIYVADSGNNRIQYFR